MRSNYYPPDGYDWVEMAELQRLAAQNNALADEVYAKNVRDFRYAFFDKLLAHDAVDEGYGWATFVAEEEPGSVATLGKPEILLASSSKLRFRVVSNELLEINNAPLFLAEEVTISPSGYAQYSIDVMHIQARPDETYAKAFLRCFEETNSAIFVAGEDSLILKRPRWFTAPIMPVADPSGRGPKAIPFGVPNVALDKLYALSKANELLQSVLDLEPSLKHTKPK